MPARQPRTARWSRTRRWAIGLGLLAAGGTGGGILASAISAGASTPQSNPAPAANEGAASLSTASGMGLSMSGTVAAVGPSSVTIRTATGTTIYTVTAGSDIVKNGEATLKSLAVGDAVTFNTVSGATKPTIDKLHAGREALDRPAGGDHGPRSGMELPSTGTVTAVGPSSVTIRTATGTTTYTVTAGSDIDKNGEATLKSLAVGDAVTFNTVSGATKPTIDKLHAGREALDRPAGGDHGPRSGGAPGDASGVQ